MLAATIAPQELALSKEECDKLSTAIGAVQRHYNTMVSAKTLDWFNLFGVCGMVYGPRLMAAKIRKASEPKKRPENRPTNGTTIPGVGHVQLDPAQAMQ